MSIFSWTSQTKKIKERYFRNKAIIHHGDCVIYAESTQYHRGGFCDCGLIHDLAILEWTLASILYPKFEEDLHMHETGKKYTKKKTDAATLKLLEDIFGPKEVNIAEVHAQYEDMKTIISVVFDKKIYPQCYRRLESWYKKELQYDKNASESKVD